jgi:tetratricopeptide (TPR) repeat protein
MAFNVVCEDLNWTKESSLRNNSVTSGLYCQILLSDFAISHSKESVVTRITTTKFAICLLLAALSTRSVSQGLTASELLQRGIYLEETVGDLDAAMGIYKQVVQMPAVSRVNAAQAEYRMGLCQQKQGHRPEAINTFQKLIREYPEQAAIVAKAREFLPAESRLQGNANPCNSLENQVAADPQDISLRERTISCYWEAESRVGFSSSRSEEFEKSRVEHLLWVVQHAPESEPASSPLRASTTRSSDNYERIRQAWMSQVQTHPDNLKVLVHAALFMIVSESDKAEELASRAHALDPKNVRAASVLAQIYELRMIGQKPELKIQAAQQALQLREQIFAATDPGHVFALQELQHLAIDAFEAGDTVRAQKYAQELARHDDADALHQGNVILGRLALKNGNLEEAKARLLAAGKIPGSSPVLSSFGPNMKLAQELLMKGEKEVVLQYFDECAVFWKYGANKLDEWKLAVGQGRIPNFGSSLIH